MKFKPYRSFFVLVILSVQLEGCVGAGSFLTKSQLVNFKETGALYCIRPDEGDLSSCSEGLSPRKLTLDDFKRAWGNPRSVTTKGSLTSATYYSGLAWRGFAVFVLIPIPLVLPVGFNNLTLEFEDGKLINFTNEFAGSSIAICGLLVTGFGCVGPGTPLTMH